MISLKPLVIRRVGATTELLRQMQKNWEDLIKVNDLPVVFQKIAEHLGTVSQVFDVAIEEFENESSGKKCNWEIRMDSIKECRNYAEAVEEFLYSPPHVIGTNWEKLLALMRHVLDSASMLLPFGMASLTWQRPHYRALLSAGGELKAFKRVEQDGPQTRPGLIIHGPADITVNGVRRKFTNGIQNLGQGNVTFQGGLHFG